MKNSNGRSKTIGKAKFAFDKKALKNIKLVAVAYSKIEREWFPTLNAYKAELEVEKRAGEVIDEIKRLGLNARPYLGDQYFLPHVIVDDPDLVVNLVDTVKGKDRLQTAIPAALELMGVPYTGAGMSGLVIGNNRHLFKQLLIAHEIPTPPYHLIQNIRKKVPEDLGFPLIVKLNESGGSVGIDNDSVKETLEDAQKRVEKMLKTYKIPVIVEKFIPGPEITGVVYDDGFKRHVFLAQKDFAYKVDGKYYFSSQEAQRDDNSYKYIPVEKKLAAKIEPLVSRAFIHLRYRDYAKFDIRVDEETSTPYFTDCNPNTAFGPKPGLPMTELLAMHGVKFSDLLASLLSKHAKSIKK